MGRGGGTSGSRGGGSRGFSSHRSSAGSSSSRSFSRGGSKTSASPPRTPTGRTQSTPPRHSTPPPLRHTAPPPRRSAPPPRYFRQPPLRRRYGAPPPPPGGYMGPPRRGIGCFGWTILILVILAVIFSVPYNMAKKLGRKPAETGQNSKIEQPLQPDTKNNTSGNTANTDEPVHTTKEKLDEELCIPTEKVFDDTLDWLTDTETVEQAIDFFYEKTGVQPYLYICDNLDGKGGEITDEEAESYLQALYDSLYDDEGHMIFVFMEYAESEYITFLYTGMEADSVIDADAREILLNNADQYYTDSTLSDEEYFSKIFQESAKTIMGSD